MDASDIHEFSNIVEGLEHDKARLEREVIELKRQLANARHKPSPPDTSDGPTFAEMKLLPTYKKVAVIVSDPELCIDRVSAYHHSVEDALETAVRQPRFAGAAIYVRHSL